MVASLVRTTTHFQRLIRRIVDPTVAIGLMLIAASWTTAAVKTVDDAEAVRKDLIADMVNISYLLEQDYLRTATELDRIIRYLRRTYERENFNVNWARLVQEDFASSTRIAQVAIIDANGYMLTSSAMPYPKTRVDLSDREHFRFHRGRSTDDLHVSKPVIGRASGKWSLQFTRRFADVAGNFAGVIVVSLDPEQLMSVYSKLEVPPNAGFALLGSDDIIRAGASRFAGLIGRPYRDGQQQSELPSKYHRLNLLEDVANGEPRLVAIRSIFGSDLSVVVTFPDAHRNKLWVWNKLYFYALVFSALVLVTIIATVAGRRRHLRRITDLAHLDSLTQLRNRLSFRRDLSELLLAVDSQGPFALHFIDLDRFKAVNDSYGHAVGDELLCSVAQRLVTNTRDTDTVYRFGGDEFAVLQPGCSSPDNAAAVAGRICRIMAEPFRLGGKEIHIGASVGVAMADGGLLDASALLKAADMALYAAKGDGRGVFRIYGQELTVLLLRRQKLDADLRVAIAKSQFELHYQPKVMLGCSGHLPMGFEALLRWRHPERGMISPNDFIGIAEESGLIVKIGRWVLEEACREFAGRPSAGSVAVNVSAVQFSSDDVAAAVQEALESSGLEPHRLEIEITESALMRNESVIVAQLQRLRALGVKISLDDFGTGYSSLAYLERYPIDCIKIDRSFIAKLCTDDKSSAVTRAIVTLSAELGMLAVAEGVEETAQVDELIRIGCHAAQGYFFGRPLPAQHQWSQAA